MVIKNPVYRDGKYQALADLCRFVKICGLET